MYGVNVTAFMSLNIYKLPGNEIINYSSTPKSALVNLMSKKIIIKKIYLTDRFAMNSRMPSLVSHGRLSGDLFESHRYSGKPLS